jgi:hypothetical protein
MIALHLGAWLAFGYEQWGQVALELGMLCISLRILQPKRQKIWATLGWIGIGLCLLGLVMNVINFIRN